MPTVVTVSTVNAAALAIEPAAKIHCSRVNVGTRDNHNRRPGGVANFHAVMPSQATTIRFSVHGKGIVDVRLATGSTYAPPGGSGGTHRRRSRGKRKSNHGHARCMLTESGRR